MVVSSAVRPDNVEILEAKKRQIPVIPRAEMLAELMRLKYGVAVAGSHGKTTTTSMVATVLVHAGHDPTVVIGGRLNALGSNAKLGKGDFIVAEADESDGSFLKLSPTIAVITNIDREHMDHYTDLSAILDAFAAFANKVPFYGSAILCLEDPNVQAVIPRIQRRIVAYGTSGQADLMASHIEFEDFGAAYSVSHHGKLLGKDPAPGAGPAQCPELCGGDRCGTGTRHTLRHDCRCPGDLPERRSQIPDQGRARGGSCCR